MKKLLQFVSLTLTVLFCVYSVYGQEPIGGPYTKDANTMLLLHFDSNLKNESSFSVDGVLHTNSPSKNFYVPGLTGLGQCLRIGNDAKTDSSYVTVADTSYLDLTGDWTIEGWINVFTFGDAYGDYRWVPRLVIKPGDDVFWRPNYWVELWGDNRWFQVGFHNTAQDTWLTVTSSPNVMKPGVWVHLTFIRDDKRKIIVQMVHDQNKKLIFFGSKSYADLADPIPITTNQAVHIGWAGAVGIPTPSDDSWLDGFVDEIRISNIVRNFAVPPLISNVTELPNQQAGTASYNIDASIEAFSATGSITKALLYYNTGTKWDSIAMVKGTGNLFSSAIPQQPLGSTIKYYVAATDNNGLRAVYPQDAEFASSPIYLTFAIFQKNTQTLKLTFDEGPGKKPIDASPYKNKVITFRTPDYSTDAKQGQYSLLLKSVAPSDSNWVEVPSSFVSSDEFCVDVWLKTDSLIHATRIVNLPRVATEWNQNNYEISFRTNPLLTNPSITGRYWTDDASGRMITLQFDNETQTGKWYHVIFERDSKNAMTALGVFDENDKLIQKKTIVDSVPVLGGAPLRIGRAQTQLDNWWFIPPFRGKIDNLTIYNYPYMKIATAIGDEMNSIPHQFRLEQNYPNPFTTSSEITFEIPKFENVSLIVYDMLGRKVSTIVNEALHAGTHKVSWNGINEIGNPLPSGLYVYRLSMGNNSLTKKMILMR